MKNEERAGASNQTEQASGVPATHLSKEDWIARYGGFLLYAEGFDVVPCDATTCHNSICHGWRVVLKMRPVPATQECGYCENTGNDSGPDHVVGETGPCSHCHGSGKKPATQECDPWPRYNRERGELIDKNIAGTLSDSERHLLDILNAYADARLTAAQIIRAERAECEQSSSVPAAQECECPVRKAAQTLVDEAGPITCAVRRTHINLVRALSAPCPCTQLRQERDEYLKRWDNAASERDSRLSPEAERELRATLATAQAEAERQRKAHDGLRVAIADHILKIDANLKTEAALHERTTITQPEER